MDRLGILVDTLGPNQSSFDLIGAVNWIVDNTPVDCALFQLEYSKFPAIPCAAVYNAADAYFSGGIGLATSFQTAQILAVCPRFSKKYFYVENLENGRNYDGQFAIYMNMELVTKEEYKDIISNNWKAPFLIMDKFEPQKLLELL